MSCPYFEIVCSALNIPAQERFHGFEQRLWLQHHALAAAEGAVVHGPMAVMGEGAQVVDADVHQFGFARTAHDSVVERADKEIGKDGYDVELHGWHSVPKRATM